MNKDGESEAEGTRKICQSLAIRIIADGNNGAVDAIDADEGSQAVHGAKDGDTIDSGALEAGIIVDKACNGANARAIHEFEQNTSLSTGTKNDDCHRGTCGEE